jgi:hypothetical protein
MSIPNYLTNSLINRVLLPGITGDPELFHVEQGL